MIKSADFALSVIVPVYNEKQSLQHNVKCALNMNGEFIREVIMIVAPHADEGTRKVCRDLSEYSSKVSWHIQKKSPGLGCALREGFALATGTHVQILYADCESPPEKIADLIGKARETGADMVVASRWMNGGGAENYPAVRYIFNRAYQGIFRVLFRTRLHDLTFGYNLVRMDVVRRIIWHGCKHEIATEMVLKALKMGCHIEEVPVVWKRRTEERSTLNTTRYLLYPLMAMWIFLSPKRCFIT